MKKIILFVMTAYLAFSAAVPPVSAVSERDTDTVSISGQKKHKDYDYDYEYDVDKDEFTSITVKVPNIGKFGYTVTDKSVIKVRKVSYKNGTAKISVAGFDEGVSYLKIYDKRNTKKSVMIKINVLGNEKDISDEDKENTERSAVPTEEEAYEAIIAMKDKYPDGTEWGSEKYYVWKGGMYSGGLGCAAFAFELSDAAFGDLPARKHTDYSNIRVGDILQVNSGMHSVVVLEISDTEVTVAEGNFNRSVKWGRTLNIQELDKNGNCIITRYPEE